MNDLHKEPLFTSWPTPLTLQNLKECFSVKKKSLKNKIKDKVKPLSHFSYFFNLFSASTRAENA